MGITKFDKTWWTGEHGMFGAHEAGGLLGAQAHFLKTTYYYKIILSL
jgi:hypothetical protein